MILSDYHIHTTFSDGKNTPEEMVKAAMEKGVRSIGFSDHSYTYFDESYCMKREDKALYLKTVADLKKRYSGVIDIYCGIEQDYYSLEKTDGYDYVIGSVHYVKAGDKFIPVDESAEEFKKAVENYFGGDTLSFAEAYFETVTRLAEKTNCDIIGHFDLISKFNEKGLFDEQNPRYVTAWKKAADNLLKSKKPFEINTGAISRGYKTSPYPSKEMIDYINKNGGSFILSSDAHSKDGICYRFEEF